MLSTWGKGKHCILVCGGLLFWKLWNRMSRQWHVGGIKVRCLGSELCVTSVLHVHAVAAPEYTWIMFVYLKLYKWPLMMYEDLLRVGGDFNHNHWKLNIGNRVILPRQWMTVQGVMASHPVVVVFLSTLSSCKYWPFSLTVQCSSHMQSHSKWSRPFPQPLVTTNSSEH